MPKLSAALQRDLEAGLALHQAHQLDQAEALYRRVLAQAPRNPDALNLLGVIAQERGRPAEAVQLIASAVRIRRSFPEALTNLARAQRAAGDPEGAAESARRAVELAPELAEAHAQLGRALLDLHDDAGAAQACRRAVALAPNAVDAQVNLGAALTRLKEFHEAAQVYQVAHALLPERAETLTDFGTALAEIDRCEDALRCHERAIELAPNDPRAHAAHAATLRRAQDVPATIEACRRTLALQPDRIDMWLMLGGAMGALGRFGDAADCYRRVLELDPEFAEARRGMVAVGEQLADEAEVARLSVVADDPAAADQHRIAASYALAALLDKASDHDAAFARLTTANWLTRARHAADGKAFDRNEFRDMIDTIIAMYSPARLAATRDWGDPSELPVFVVGMPRSGTTLTEQILASHPRAFGAGERRDIGRIGRTLEADSGSSDPARWAPAAVLEQATAHLARMRAVAGEVDRVIDKMPDNVLWLGLIALLFPRARIVLCRRDLRDICLSCYFQSFSEGMAWTNDLEDCAFRALQVERLVRHWRATLPLPMLELSYESLVADLEGESRRLIEFVGLPWDAACLDFHTTQRPVMTASLWQVRQPLYTSSVGRWQYYRRHLTPLITALDENDAG